MMFKIVLGILYRRNSLSLSLNIYERVNPPTATGYRVDNVITQQKKSWEAKARPFIDEALPLE